MVARAWFKRALVLLVLLAMVGWTTVASACGGFFCNNMSMDQVGEQIIFGVDGPSVTATISIAFEGDAEDFGWVIPVLSAPEISLAPQGMFSTLAANTQPYYYLQWDYDAPGNCMGWMMMEDMDGGGFGGGMDGGGGGGVQVIDSSEVGPYETVTLQSDSAQELFQWLNDSGFVQPDTVLPLTEHYLDNDFLFVAMKLKQGSGSGEIQPVTLSFADSEPCVPLVLTQIAAQPDMPILIWALSDTQGTPRNWFRVELNEKKINWMGNGSNYDEVLTQAIDEAAGHGFTTEYAQAIDMSGWLYKEGQFDTEALKGLGVVDFLYAIQNQGYPRDSQLLEMLKKYIPMPAAQTLPPFCQDEDSFYNWNIFQCVGEMPDGWDFDSVAFADELQARVVEPMKEAQEILDRHDYMTRLYSTVSPDEMTRDPLFHFNPDLPDVSNQHIAEAVATCSEEGTLETVVITLDNGESFTVEGPEEYWWGWMSDEEWGDPAPDEGAASSISLVGTDGEPVEIDPVDVKTVDARLDKEDASMVLADLKLGIIDGPPDDVPDVPEPPVDTGDEIPEIPETPETPDETPVDDIGNPVPDTSSTTGPSSSDDGGCGGAGGSTTWWPALLGLLLLFRRRWA